jgi:hypothetical protein
MLRSELNEPVCEVSSNGDKCWRLRGKRHRLDGPALEWHDGTKSWYKYGKHHRDDGPAVEHAHGYKAWYLNGQFLDVEKSINDPRLKRKYPKLIESMVIYLVHKL